jgi:hypothetical protein
METFPGDASRLDSFGVSIRGLEERLSKDHLAHVDMRLSDLERLSLREMRIERESESFDSFGPIDDAFTERLKQHLSSIGSNEPAHIERISRLIHRIARGMQGGVGKEAAWFTLRISLPNYEFDIPRWHADGSYFATANKTYKLVATLKGPRTLFGKVVDPAAYRTLENASSENYLKNFKANRHAFLEEDMRIRKELTKVIEQTGAPTEEQATIYLVGDENGVVHSEPAITEPRIFFSIVAGSKEEIEELRRRFETEQ